MQVGARFKIFLGPTYVDNQLWFWNYSPIFLFLIWPHLGPLALFCALRGYLFGPLGLFLGSRSGSKTFLEPTNVDHQFLFWKYSPIFLFLIWPNFGPFCTFWAFRGYFILARWGYFWGRGQVQKHFWNLLI